MRNNIPLRPSPPHHHDQHPAAWRHPLQGGSALRGGWGARRGGSVAAAVTNSPTSSIASQ